MKEQRRIAALPYESMMILLVMNERYDKIPGELFRGISEMLGTTRGF